jgi:MFS family permease
MSKNVGKFSPDSTPTLDSVPRENEQIKEINAHISRGWLSVIGTVLIFLPTFGLSNSVGLIQSYLESHQLRAFAPRDVGWIIATNVCLSLLVPAWAGPAFDKYGERGLLIIGGMIYFAGLIPMAILDSNEHGAATHNGEGNSKSCSDNGVTTFLFLFITWGIFCGSACGIFGMAGVGAVSQWFGRRRGLALGIVAISSPIGGIMYPLILKETLDQIGWRSSILIIALLTGVLYVSGSFLIQGRPEKRTTTSTSIGLQCFKKGGFLWMTLSFARKSAMLKHSLES